ncbi:MAG: hypothetical protein MZV49_18935 [Rhodopseudomonas palustris]|nr:hypothetical protein [Rhodopseudomonas palustris]
MLARLERGAANLGRETRFNEFASGCDRDLSDHPAPNAIDTLQQVRKLMAGMEQRFPQDLAWKVTYDPDGLRDRHRSTR